MYRLFILACSLLSLFSLNNAFSLQSQSQPQSYSQYPNDPVISGCLMNKVTSITNILNYCQQKQNQLQAISICFTKNMTVVQDQKWNIIIRKNTSQDFTSYWLYDNCTLMWSNYGIYNHTYTIWPSRQYQPDIPNMRGIQKQNFSKKQKTIFEQQQQQQQKQLNEQNDQLRATCSVWQQDGIYNALTYCDFLQKNSEASQCIVDLVKTHINQYFGAYVASTPVTSWIQINIFDCKVSVVNYGKHNRNIIVWKGYPSLVA